MKGSITGTCHFRNKQSALKYYQGVGAGYTKENIENKILTNEIVIGLPDYDLNKQMCWADKDGRYMIEDIGYAL